MLLLISCELIAFGLLSSLRSVQRFSSGFTRIPFGGGVVGYAYKDILSEVKRVVLTSPNWLPGEKNGIKVPMKLTYPVHFVIDTDALKANVQK